MNYKDIQNRAIMKTKHTPGEWVFKEWKQEGTDFYHIRSKKEFTDLIATVHRWKGYIDKREAEANAKLIAAAPDMLKALTEVRRHGLIEKDGYETIVKEVNEAINKATE